ncbi:MAG: sigma-70 family RNA polymerase sigma factor [Akkermansiaceae bacterium]
MTDPSDTSSADYQGAFHPTAWTCILQARDGSETSVRQALEHLADLYWKPVFYHIRRKGYGVHDAEDLSQEFFRRFIERKGMEKADPEKGRFRTFLLGSVNHFLCDEYDKRTADKRTPVSDTLKEQPEQEEAHSFDRDWATVVIDRAFARLREQAPREARILEAQRGGKTRYRDLAEELGATEGHVKVMAQRGRTKLRHFILDHLRDTSTSEKEAQQELTQLFAALAE